MHIPLTLILARVPGHSWSTESGLQWKYVICKSRQLPKHVSTWYIYIFQLAFIILKMETLYQDQDFTLFFSDVCCSKPSFVAWARVSSIVCSINQLPQKKWKSQKPDLCLSINHIQALSLLWPVSKTDRHSPPALPPSPSPPGCPPAPISQHPHWSLVQLLCGHPLQYHAWWV